jgi:hypothetical protein
MFGIFSRRIGCFFIIFFLKRMTEGLLETSVFIFSFLLNKKWRKTLGALVIN